MNAELDGDIGGGGVASGGKVGEMAAEAEALYHGGDYVVRHLIVLPSSALLQGQSTVVARSR